MQRMAGHWALDYDCQLYLALFSNTMRSRAPVVSTETIPDHLGDESVLVSKTINTRFFLVLRPQKFPLTNQEGTPVNFLPQVLHGCTFSQLFCKPCLCCGNEPLPRPGTWEQYGRWSWYFHQSLRRGRQWHKLKDDDTPRIGPSSLRSWSKTWQTR